MLCVADRPKVRMPRFLRQRYVAHVGDKINLTIPFTVSATRTPDTPDIHLGYT